MNRRARAPSATVCHRLPVIGGRRWPIRVESTRLPVRHRLPLSAGKLVRQFADAYRRRTAYTLKSQEHRQTGSAGGFGQRRTVPATAGRQSYSARDLSPFATLERRTHTPTNRARIGYVRARPDPGCNP